MLEARVRNIQYVVEETNGDLNNELKKIRLEITGLREINKTHPRWIEINIVFAIATNFLHWDGIHMQGWKFFLN